VVILRYEIFADQSLVSVGGGQAENCNHRLGIDHAGNLGTVDPLSWSSSLERGLAGEKPSPARSHPHHPEDQSGLCDMW
jgi:hypothetical protein